MICERCGWPMMTRQIQMDHDVMTYYFRSTCTKNRGHVVCIDPEEEHDEVTA